MAKKQTQPASKTTRVQHHVRHLLVPHKGNQYRPHLMRLHGLTAILVIALLAQVAYGFMTYGRLAVLGRVSTIDTAQLIELTNQQRTTDSLPALTVNQELSQAAALKAQDMFTNDYWAHTSPSGVAPWQWLGDVGYRYSVAGENLAKNYPTATATVDAWMASPSHRENILNSSYTEVGFAVVDGVLEGRDATLVVAYYGAPAAGAVAGAAQAPVQQNAAATQGIGNPLTYFGSALQSLSPASLGTLGLLVLVALVALSAHQYRYKLPKAWRQSWKAHHGMFTMIGVVGLGVLVVLATGGGQICKD